MFWICHHDLRFPGYEDAARFDCREIPGIDLIVNGHAHNYERFAPQDANGNLDTARGIIEIVAGTGGEGHYSFNSTAAPNSLVRNSDTFGVLRLTLHQSSFDWKFIPVAGMTFTDSGTQACH